MKKLILKTILTTILSLFSAIAILVLSLSIFAPKSLARCFEFFNNQTLALKFYEKQYEKTKDIDDLFVIVNKVDSRTQSQSAEKYLGYFVISNEFISFCENVDANSSQSIFKTQDFVLGKFVESVYYNSGIDSATKKSAQLVEEFGYSECSPFYILITSLGQDLNEQDRTKIKLKIESVYAQLEDDEQVFALKDINLLQGI